MKIVAILKSNMMLYLAAGLFAVQMVVLLYKVCKTSFSNEYHLGLAKLVRSQFKFECVSILKCFLTL